MAFIWGQFHKRYPSHQFTKVSLKITGLKLNWNLPGANELKSIRYIHILNESYLGFDLTQIDEMNSGTILVCPTQRDSLTMCLSSNYNVIMVTMASQITSLTIVNQPGAYQRKIKATHHWPLCLVTGEFPAQMASNAENVFIWWCHHVLAHSKSIRHIKIIHFFLFHIEGHIKLEQYGEKAHRRQIVRLSLYTANAMPADALVTLEARSIQFLLILWLLMSPEHQQALYWPSKPDYSVSSIRRVKGLIQIISS